MGRKRQRDEGDGQPAQGDSTAAERAAAHQPAVAAQPAFHLPTPRPPVVPASSAPQPAQFHLPTPRPPPPASCQTERAKAAPSQPRPQQPQPINATTAAQPTKHQQPATAPGKKKRKHRKRKATAPPPEPVDQSLPLPAVARGHFHVFVGGLPYVATVEQIRQYFQRDGCYVWDVRMAQYGTDSEWPGEGRGFCHVELENEQQVARSLLRHGQLWSDGQSILTVQLAKPKWDRQQQTADAPRPGAATAALAVDPGS